MTFGPLDRTDPLAGGNGSVEMVYEDRLPPGASVLRWPPQDAEIITYVREGALIYEDSWGRSGTIPAGEFHRVTTARDVRHVARNASQTEWAHVFRLTLRGPGSGHDSGQEQKRFSTADRRNGLCVVASPDARRGSLRVLQDALVYSAMLDRGQHMVYELSPERRGWLHVVQGELTLGDLALGPGDGVVVVAERALSFTARDECEVLLVDLGDGAAGRAPK